ncbi:MAG: sialate O-acetylesterase [Candidatus Scatosoma sp.]
MKKRVNGLAGFRRISACCLCFVAALYFAVSGCTFFVRGNSDVAAEETATPIDMYLIAGQSNAAGYSSKGWTDLKQTFDNVWYGGETDKAFRTGSYGASYLTFNSFVRGVRTGLGAKPGFVGPEYGIAEAINSYYENRSDGRKAFIFKSAAGGTGLHDNHSGLSGTYGNWYPRSLWTKGYEPEIDNPNENSLPTGVLYASFIKNFATVYNELKNNGYAPEIKGMAWMQGEDDLWRSSTYGQVLETFISDMREDLAKITGDEKVYVMPFVIGKIATSFNQWAYSPVPAFNIVQQNVADKVPGAATVETSDLIIVNEDGSINGTDLYHFNCADMEILGNRFGEKLLELNETAYCVVKPSVNGTLFYNLDENGNLTVTAQAEHGNGKKYALSQLYVNGINVTAQVKDNVYTQSDIRSGTTLYAEFTELNKYSVTYSLDEKSVGVVKGQLTVYENESFTFQLGLAKGYTISNVTANGKTLVSEGNGVYTVENVTEDVEIVVVCDAVTDGGNAAEEPKPAEKGCNASTGYAAIIALPVCLLAALKKRKQR